jgi:serine/threonine protein phosphatase 1
LAWHNDLVDTLISDRPIYDASDDRSPQPARQPPQALVYAVGDIHGMDDLLDAMLAAIEGDQSHHAGPHTIVFLGDFVNRGPGSRQVLDRLIAGPQRAGGRWIVLRGNHEQTMLDALTGDDERLFRRWLKRGGTTTLQSYGARGTSISVSRARAMVGKDHLAFLASLPMTHIAGDYLFVHAGVAPGLPLASQPAATLMNIRSPFLKRPHRLPYTVVHGHTPTEGEPLIGPARIGIDTGACFTGILTSIAIDTKMGEHRFLRVSVAGR